MEEKETIVIDVQLNAKGVANQLAEVNQKIAEVKAQNAQLRKEVKEGTKSWKDVSGQLAVNEQRLKTLGTTQKALTNQFNAQVGTNKRLGDSLKEMGAELTAMKNEYRSLSAAERESAKGQELLQHIQDLDAKMKEADGTMGDFQRNVGNYPNAVKPVTAQLKEMTQALIQLRMEGKANTQEYQDLLQKTGELKDSMMDAQREVKQMASDTGALNSVLDAGKLAAGAFSAALGVMNLVGDKDSETAKAMADAQRKLQAAIAVTTGLQAVQNALQKESALMMGVSKIQIWAAAKAQDAYASAAGRATVAQRLFNTVSKSNPYVLLASLILSVVGAVAAFTLGSEEQEEQLEKTNEELRNQIQLLKEIKEAYSTLYSQSIDLQEKYIKELKLRGAETKKIREAEDDLHNTKMAALDEEYELLKYDIMMEGTYQANMMQNMEKLKEVKERYYNAVKNGQGSLAYNYKREIEDLQTLISLDKERIEVVNDYNKRRNDLIMEGIEREKERDQQDAQAAEQQRQRRQQAYNDYLTKLKTLREETIKAYKDITDNLPTLRELEENESARMKKFADNLQYTLEKTGLFKKELEEIPRIAIPEFELTGDELGNTTTQMELFAEAFKENSEAIQESSTALQSSFSSLSTIYQQMTKDETKTEEEREKYARKAKAWAKMQIAANAGTAVAKGVASAVDVGFPAAIPAILTMTAAIVSAIAQAKQLAEGYETGGVIGGYHGATMGKDNTVINARGGEMVLNASQQRQLFELANGGTKSGGMYSALADALRNMPAPVLVYSEFQRFTDRVVTLDDTAKLR